MTNPKKPIRFTFHATNRMRERGIREDEVHHVILKKTWLLHDPVQEKWESEETFPYNATWNGKMFSQKKVKAIFVENDERIVVITVLAFYFNE